MTRVLPSLRIPFVVSLALLPALAVAAPKKTKSKSGSTAPVKTSVFGAELLSVETLADGRIKSVDAHTNYGNKKFLGCGARLEDHPHLLLAFEPGFVVTIKAENHCIKSIYVSRAPS